MKNETKYDKLQSVMMDAMDLKIGDTVEVTRISSMGEFGWCNTWIPSMDAFVGKTYKVSAIQKRGMGIALEGTTWGFPIFVLRKIEKQPITIKDVSQDYDAMVHPSGDVVVGCQTITFEKLKEIYDAAVDIQK